MVFDVIGTSSWASANLSVCRCRDACSLSPCVQGHLLAVLLSDWNCLGSRKWASVVFTQGQDLSASPPVALSLCRADRNWQGRRMRQWKSLSIHLGIYPSIYLSINCIYPSMKQVAKSVHVISAHISVLQLHELLSIRKKNLGIWCYTTKWKW